MKALYPIGLTFAIIGAALSCLFYFAIIGLPMLVLGIGLIAGSNESLTAKLLSSIIPVLCVAIWYAVFIYLIKERTGEWPI